MDVQWESFVDIDGDGVPQVSTRAEWLDNLKLCNELYNDKPELISRIRASFDDTEVCVAEEDSALSVKLC